MARERLGEMLLRAGLLSQAQLVTALREQARTGVRLGQILVDHGLVEEAILYDSLAKIAGLERFNLRGAILEKSALGLVSAEWALSQRMIPFRADARERTLYVAVTDPTNVGPLDDLAFRLGLKPRVQIASETEVERVVRHHFYGEPLNRERNVDRPSAPRRAAAEIDETSILHGMDVLRDEVLRQRVTPPRFDEGDLIDPEDREALSRLKPLYEAHEEATAALRVIFNRCVARGLLTEAEYLERLRQTPD